MQLVIRDLSKRYANGVQAIDDVSLIIPPGMFGLLGPNGAGKSTLMRTLATLQSADSGSATLGDIDILHEPDKVRAVLGTCRRTSASIRRCPRSNCWTIWPGSRAWSTADPAARPSMRCCIESTFTTSASRSSVASLGGCVSASASPRH
jgi:ABC-type cobalamin/Fe3+-siderophores transport system ATPase subunit